jgi:hypothetical protein
MFRWARVLALVVAAGTIGMVLYFELGAASLRRDMGELQRSGRIGEVSRAPVEDRLAMDGMPGYPWRGRELRRMTWFDRYSGAGYVVLLDPATSTVIQVREVAVDDLYSVGGNALRVLAVVAFVLLVMTVYRWRWRAKGSRNNNL